MNIKCNDCTGHYVLREGKYGEFGGCSNYPKCTSSLKLHDLIFRFFVEEGINLYKWSRKCYKCKKDAEVYSYYLYYQLEKLDECFNYSHGLGIGDVSWIDNYLKKNISSIKECYSNVTKSKYTANTCQYCGSLQGKNYVVDDPHEIMTELFHEKSMNQFFYANIKIKETDIALRDEFYRIFSQK